jgi:hypothetical protein
MEVSCVLREPLVRQREQRVDLVLEVLVQEVGEGDDVHGLEVTAADAGHGLAQGGVLLGDGDERGRSGPEHLRELWIKRLLLDLGVLLFRGRDRLHHRGQDRMGRLQLDQATQHAELLQEDAVLDLQAIRDLHVDLAMEPLRARRVPRWETCSSAGESSVGAQSFRGASTEAHSFRPKPLKVRIDRGEGRYGRLKWWWSVTARTVVQPAASCPSSPRSASAW